MASIALLLIWTKTRSLLGGESKSFCGPRATTPATPHPSSPLLGFIQFLFGVMVWLVRGYDGDGERRKGRRCVVSGSRGSGRG